MFSQRHTNKTGSGNKLAASIALALALTSCGGSDSSKNTGATATPARDKAAIEAEIRLNQLGFHPQQQKLAIILSEQAPEGFSIVDVESGAPLIENGLLERAPATWSGKSAWIADFSQIRREGNYLLKIPGTDSAAGLSIQDDVYADLGMASLKAFYLQRASMDIEAAYAGQWARRGGHPDDQVQVHPSAASASRPAGSLISSPGGWYDAGDYNKYIVNSGITMGTLLAAYENYPDYFRAQNINIPESGNSLPDILDEILYNLHWMQSMQDPQDGGVYHKLTTAGFEGMVAPANATQQRYVVQKSTAAALDFAAVMAQAARVFKPTDAESAGRYLQAAERAWQWARQNPQVPYSQESINEAYDPDIATGEYGDNTLGDEWSWAAAELAISSGKAEFWDMIREDSRQYQLPNWGQVQWLGYYSLLRNEPLLRSQGRSPAWLEDVKNRLIAAAEVLREQGARWTYRAPMGSSQQNFPWGSNSVAANQGILMLEAYRLTGDEKFLHSAEDNLDYLLGRNATGYAYVTGFGTKSPQHPHHRLAAYQPEIPPPPGFLVGGPNPGQQDGCDYPSDVADESYSDTQCSYASNEIAINWNAPLVYLVNGLAAVRSEK